LKGEIDKVGGSKEENPIRKTRFSRRKSNQKEKDTNEQNSRMRKTRYSPRKAKQKKKDPNKDLKDKVDTGDDSKEEKPPLRKTRNSQRKADQKEKDARKELKYKISKDDSSKEAKLPMRKTRNSQRKADQKETDLKKELKYENNKEDSSKEEKPSLRQTRRMANQKEKRPMRKKFSSLHQSELKSRFDNSSRKRKRQEVSKHLPSRSTKRKPQYQIMITGFEPSKKDKNNLDAFNAILIDEKDNISTECTHLVLKRGLIKRTLKLLLCMSMPGIKSPRIVHEDWINASASQSKIANEIDYVPFDKRYIDGCGTRKLNMAEALIRRDTGKKLLNGKTIHVTKNVRLPLSELEQIISNQGGKLAAKGRAAVGSSSILLIGEKDLSAALVKKALKGKIEVFWDSWLTDLIIDYRIPAAETYRVQ